MTAPLVVLYLALAFLLATIHIALVVAYGMAFILVAVFQAYCCVHQDCPYIGRFCPGAGGFCVPASRIAKLWRNVERSDKRFNLFGSIAFLNLLVIVFLPVYFLYQWNPSALLAYFAIVVAYTFGMLLLICPVCAIRDICPGGRTSDRLRLSFRHSSQSGS
jgi:hypothetical protein